MVAKSSSWYRERQRVWTPCPPGPRPISNGWTLHLALRSSNPSRKPRCNKRPQTRSVLPEDTQAKLQALGIGPSKPDEPELTDILKTHMDALPPQVQQIVTKLTAPEPCAEREIATKLKGQVTELKAMSTRKNQLQEKIDGVKAQYASLLTDMQDLQSKLADGQKALHQLSQDYMKAINQTPAPAELATGSPEPEQIPMAVESSVHSLGISLTEEQKSQLHGLLKRAKPGPRRSHEAQENRWHCSTTTRTLWVTGTAMPC